MFRWFEKNNPKALGYLITRTDGFFAEDEYQAYTIFYNKYPNRKNFTHLDLTKTNL